MSVCMRSQKKMVANFEFWCCFFPSGKIVKTCMFSMTRGWMSDDSVRPAHNVYTTAYSVLLAISSSYIYYEILIIWRLFTLNETERILNSYAYSMKMKFAGVRMYQHTFVLIFMTSALISSLIWEERLQCATGPHRTLLSAYNRATATVIVEHCAVVHTAYTLPIWCSRPQMNSSGICANKKLK